MAKLFLYLTNTRLVSLTTRARRLQARREFAVSGAGLAEFHAHLQSVRDTPVYLFTDLAEEDFRLDTIPHVGANDRQAILSRRLGQIYRNSPYRYARQQGREPDGRRDDRVLYTAVTNPDVLRPWLEIIDQLKVPLAGIYSSAVFSAALLEELDLGAAHTLLVTFSPGDTLRQTYFRDGEFKFSRLTPVDLDEGQTLGAMIAEEATRTWQYLDSLRHFAADDRLEVCILLHRNERSAIEPYLRSFAQMQYRILDIEEVAVRIGLAAPPRNSSAEEILVHLFLKHPAENNFATPEMRRYAVLRHARLTLNFVTLAVLSVGASWTGANLYRLYAGAERDQAVVRQVAELNREQEEITRSLPSLGVAGSTMRDVVTFYNSSIRSFPAITEFLSVLSTILDMHPAVQLNQIVWQATDDPRLSPVISMAPPRNAPPVKVVPKAGEGPGPAPADDPNNPTFAGGRYQVALIEATIRVPTNDFRGALNKVEALVTDISARPSFNAQIVESPLDIRSSLLLQGRHGEKDPDSMEPRFVLRIVRESGAP